MTANNSSPYLYDPDRCPWTAAWRVIGGKWKGILWWRLSNGVGRFGELRRAVPQITKKMLAQQLRELVRDGIVRREASGGRGDSPGSPAWTMPRVEYSLTEYGRSLKPVIDAICRWGGRHLERRAAGGGVASTSAGDDGRRLAAASAQESDVAKPRRRIE
jgi:DNA-binding HxlR family transcriptional regulator